MAASLLRRGSTLYVRVTLPPDRWADIGAAMGAPSGLKREIVKTLGTTDRKVAAGRLDAAAAVIVQEVDDALRRAKLRPLSDWRSDWMPRALQRQEELREHGDEPIGLDELDDDHQPVGPMTADAIIAEQIEEDAEALGRRRGGAAAEQFRRVAFQRGMTVAEGQRRWLAERAGDLTPGTVASYEAALAWLESYLKSKHGIASFEGSVFSDVTRKMAGAAVEARRSTHSGPTVAREFAAYSGLWRWARRRGHATENPWEDQLAGVKAPRQHDAGRGRERGYTSEELVKLLKAAQGDFAPNGGGYAPVFFDLIRLLLLTGARANEIMGLSVRDVLEDGTVLALASQGGKTAAASRIVPLDPLAQRVIASRLADLHDTAPTAPLWPEVPAGGRDGRRSKTISTRFPAIRTRILGASNEVDLHSFRRSFLTAAETALHGGGRINAETVALLAGHKRQGLAWNLYSDWSRLGRTGFRGRLQERLQTLRDAVEDIVTLGFDKAIRAALTETADARPPQVRTAPAFSRKR